MSSKTKHIRLLSHWKPILRCSQQSWGHNVRYLSTSTYRQPPPPPPRLPLGVSNAAIINSSSTLTTHVDAGTDVLMISYSPEEDQDTSTTSLHSRKMPRTIGHICSLPNIASRPTRLSNASILQNKSRFCQSWRYTPCALQVR